MTNYKCPNCYREKETNHKAIMVICPACQTQMLPFPFNFKKEVEVNGEHDRNKIYTD